MYKDVGKVRKQEQNLKFVQDDEEVQAIKNSIKNILITKQGTLPGDPLFGSGLSGIVFDIMDGLTQKLQDSFVRESLQKYEPRVLVKDVSLKEIPEYNQISVRVRFEYIDKRTGELLQDTANVPFDFI